MKFNVKFVSDKGFAINIDGRKIGVNGVEKIREDLGVQLDVERISDYIEALRVNPRIELDFETAKDSGHFDEVPEVKVKTPDSLLNVLCYIETSTTKNGKTGEIHNANLARRIDREAILSEWREAGYPLEWGIEESEKSK